MDRAGLMANRPPSDWNERLVCVMRQAFHWASRHLPPGLRALCGIVLMVAGVFGFLPILGFWMLPIGAVLVAMDIPPLRRRLRKRLEPKSETRDID